MVRRRGAIGSRRGLTLMEILLVLAIIVAMSALAWPTLERPFAAERLRRSGDQIRAHWSRARNRAVESGEVYSFQCQLQGGRYLVERYAGLDVETAQSTGFGVNATQSSVSTAATLKLDETLPHGITITAFEVDQDNRTTSQTKEFGTEDPSTSRDETWSQEVLFFPDGSTTSAELTLQNQFGASITVSLRGLTGVSKLGEVSGGSETAEPTKEKR